MHAIAARSACNLVDQPLMRNVLADLALESEAATVLFTCGSRRRSSNPPMQAQRRPPPIQRLHPPSAHGGAS